MASLVSYQLFKMVVEQGSFNKASELLNLTPSAVSHAIHAMEKEFGSALFVRTKKGIGLTTYGEYLQPYINSVLNAEESLKQAVSEFNGLQQGRVKLGCFSSVCMAWVPDIISSFKREFPNIDIQIYQGTYDDVVSWIRNGTVDIGFLSTSSADGLDITPLYRDPLLLVAPKGKVKTANSKVITPNEMNGMTFISQRDSVDADIQMFLHKYSISVQSGSQVVDDLSQIAMVSSGLGMCIIPELCMKDIPYKVDVFKIVPEEYRTIGLSVLNHEFMAPAARTLFDHICSRYKRDYI